MINIIDQKNDVIKCSKIQVELRAVGKWFHYKVLDTLRREFYGLQECRPWKIVVNLISTLTPKLHR